MTGGKKNKKLKYQDYYEEMASGFCHGVFIDDTGSPGIKDAPPNFHPKRKTWVAVIIPQSQIAEIMHEMPQAIDEMKKHMSGDEFHFTDIYSGRKKFKGVDLSLRLSLFEFMAHIFSIYRFPIIVQTFDPDTLLHFRSRAGAELPETLPPFDFSKCEDSALFLLLSRIKWFIEKMPNFPDTKARVFIDEGYKKSGIGIRIPIFDHVFSDGQICFANSSSIFPIQLADFAAFSLNRMQLLGGRETRSPIDVKLLEILSSANFNYTNLEMKYVDPNQDGPIFTLAETRPNGP